MVGGQVGSRAVGPRVGSWSPRPVLGFPDSPIPTASPAPTSGVETIGSKGPTLPTGPPRGTKGSVARPVKRRWWLSWLPTSIVASLCVAVVIGVIAMQNSWWTDPNPVGSADQVAADGTSLFGDAGADFFTRQGIVRLKVNTSGLPASELGLDPDAVQTFEPPVPIKAVVLGEDGAFYLDPVRSFSITTVDNEVQSVTIEREGDGRWQSVLAELESMQTSWGWTSEDLKTLSNDLAAAAASSPDKYTATVGPVEAKGSLVSAEVSVDGTDSRVDVAFTISATD